jgi:DHA2 family multidrug resistance protein
LFCHRARRSIQARLHRLGLIALTFGSLEVVLDKGQQDDWFSSHFIVSFLAVTAIGLVCLVIWELRQERVGSKPILDLRLFALRNFSVSFLMMFVLGFTLYATTVLLPQLLQSLMGYTARALEWPCPREVWRRSSACRSSAS